MLHLPGDIEIASRGRGRRRVADDPFEQANHVLCLILRVRFGLSVKEVAVIMGKSERTVKWWTSLALGYYGHPAVKEIRKLIAKAIKPL